MLFIKWSFGQPPSPLNCPRGLWMTPKCDLKNPIPLEEKEGLNSENSILLVLYTNSFRRHFVFDRVIFEPHIYLNSRFFVESCYSYCYKKWFATFSGWEHLMGFNLVEKNPWSKTVKCQRVFFVVVSSLGMGSSFLLRKATYHMDLY